MTAPILAAATFCFTTTVIHVASIVIAAVRLRRRTPGEPLSRRKLPPVSLVRPLCGIDNYAADTLRSTFELDYPLCEILFCVASAKDPVVPLIEALMAEHAGTGAQLLIGDERVSSNPKLNNVLKGWRAAEHEWIVLADSNVLMPRDYIQLLFANWRTDTGLVASPPVGCQPRGPWAELECAFLNTYQARWQYVADAFGLGFAQGKTMRDAGLKVRLVDRPFAQPLGYRSAAEVWHRQLRWARLRRASFLAYFLPEALSGGVLPMVALAGVAAAVDMPPALSVAALGAVWYGSEMLLAAVAGWHLSPRYPFCCLARDLLLPVLFVKAMRGDDFVWRGNEMQVERMQPRGMMALMRPKLAELVPVARRRLRARRARMS
jgi:ceramide glucosyltransferase